MISSLEIKHKENEVKMLELELDGRRLKELLNKEDTTTINEECIGCCKVVDVAARLQEELDSAHNMYRASSDECCKQRKTIGDLRTEIYDLKKSLPDNFWAVATEKDSMIRRQGKVIEDFKTIETGETDRLHKIIDEMQNDVNIFEENDSGLRKTISDYRETIQLERIDHAATLKTVNQYHHAKIKDLNSQLTEKQEIIDKITLLRVDEVETRQGIEATTEKQNQTLLHIKAELDAAKQFNPFDLMLISGSMENISNVIDDHFTSCPTIDEWDGGVIELRSWVGRLSSTVETLEDELSALKQDSVVLMKVVEIVKNWDDSTERAFPTLIKILDELVDYTDVPEGPPETPIDEPQEITVTFAWLELP